MNGSLDPEARLSIECPASQAIFSEPHFPDLSTLLAARNTLDLILVQGSTLLNYSSCKGPGIALILAKVS